MAKNVVFFISDLIAFAFAAVLNLKFESSISNTFFFLCTASFTWQVQTFWDCFYYAFQVMLNNPSLKIVQRLSYVFERLFGRPVNA